MVCAEPYPFLFFGMCYNLINMESITEKSKKKRIIIIVIYVTIFLLILSAIAYAVKPKPNCFDGKMNQNEEGFDCGGICQKECEVVAEESIQVEKTGFVSSGIINKYDIYGQIYNPNTFFGSGEFSYQFVVKDGTGKVVAEKNGKNFILPGERKYLIENNIETNEIPVTVELVVNESEWIKFNTGDYQKPELKVVNKNYTEISSGVNFSEAIGLVKNESHFDFEKINIYVILKSPNDEVIALGSTQINSVKSGENRDFRTFWPSRFPGEVRVMDTQTDVNVFKSDSFSKRYFQTEKFQQY